MVGDGLSIEQLRVFIRELKPEAQALLIAELERALLRGDEIAGTDLILQELRTTMRERADPPPRAGSPARLFFQPLEPFLVDDGLNHKHPGRVARAALEPIWSWICRDVMATEAKAFCDEVSQALLAKDAEYSEWLTRAFQDQAIQRLQETFAAIDGDEMAGRRLAGQIGIPGALKITNEVLGVLKLRDSLAAFGARLPPRIHNLADERLEKVKMLLDEFSRENPDIFVFGLLLVMSRLTTPWQLTRLAIKAAESNRAVSAGRYAAAVRIVIAEVERLVGELKSDMKSGGIAIISLLKSIHDALRGLRIDVDPSPDSEWGRQLAMIRTGISTFLSSEIESVPRRVQHLLRPRSVDEIPPGSALDPKEVAETEILVGFTYACRKYANELAINETTQRAYAELHHYLESGPRALLDGLRHAGPDDREFRQSQIDAAVRFCRTGFGDDYAAQLARAAEVARAKTVDPPPGFSTTASVIPFVLANSHSG
jgi:hypothetical protein